MKIAPSAHPTWVKDFLNDIEPYENRILDGDCFGKMSRGELPLDTFRHIMLDFYPLVESFPKYMALILSRIPMENNDKCNMARYWLIENLNIERKHADWYRDWICAFGVPREVMDKEVFPCPEVDAVNNFLWKICTYGTIPEAIAGLNFSIEGPTGKWAKSVYKNISKYKNMEGVVLDVKSTMWLKAHARYDDHHPEEALEIIKAFALNEEEQERVRRAAINAMTYYAMASQASYKMGSQNSISAA